MKQKTKQTMEMLKQSFQPYQELYPESKLSWTLDYPNFEENHLMFSIEPNSKNFNEELVDECNVSFLSKLSKTDLFMPDNKEWVVEVSNEDLPHSIDYIVYKK